MEVDDSCEDMGALLRARSIGSTGLPVTPHMGSRCRISRRHLSGECLAFAQIQQATEANEGNQGRPASGGAESACHRSGAHSAGEPLGLLVILVPVSYTHLTLPTIYAV